MVIGHDIFALLLCQFFNLGPHPAKLLFGFFSFFGPNKPTGRKCCSGIMSNFFNFLNLFWHYYLIGNIQDHFGAIQTSSRHPQTPSRHPEIHHPFWSKMGHWKKMQYVEIKIPTRLSSIVLTLIYSRHSPEGPEIPTGGVGGAHGGRRDHQDRHQDGHQQHL